MLRRLIHRVIALVPLLAGLLLLVGIVASPASAAGATFIVQADGTTTVASTFDTAGILAMLVGTVLPLLVGAVTRQHWNNALKAVILLGVSTLAGFLAQWRDAASAHHHFAWQAAALISAITFGFGLLSHYQVWKPSGLSAALQKGGLNPTPPLQPAGLDLNYPDYLTGDDIGHDPPAADPAAMGAGMPTAQLATIHDGDAFAAGVPAPPGDTTSLAIVGQQPVPQDDRICGRHSAESQPGTS